MKEILTVAMILGLPIISVKADTPAENRVRI